MIHDTYASSLIGNDAITLRQRLEKMMINDLKKKNYKLGCCVFSIIGEKMSRYRQTMSELLKQVRGIKEQEE
jgi:hypothetical protein